MDERNKIFVSKEPTDDELEHIKELLDSKKVKDYLKENFIYIHIDNEEDSIEVMAFEDNAVLLTSKEYYLTNKQAIEFLLYSFDIDQAVKEALYWSGIGGTKKYIPVLAEAKLKSGTNKIYAEFAIYATDDVEAGILLNKMDYDEYLYLEDVDE